VGTTELSRKVPVIVKRLLDNLFFYLYNITMKTEKQYIKKVRVKTTLENYYVCSPETKEIDGVQFVYVIKNIGIRETPKLMRKESLEYVK